MSLAPLEDRVALSRALRLEVISRADPRQTGTDDQDIEALLMHRYIPCPKRRTRARITDARSSATARLTARAAHLSVVVRQSRRSGTGPKRHVRGDAEPRPRGRAQGDPGRRDHRGVVGGVLLREPALGPCQRSIRAPPHLHHRTVRLRDRRQPVRCELLVCARRLAHADVRVVRDDRRPHDAGDADVGLGTGGRRIHRGHHFGKRPRTWARPHRSREQSRLHRRPCRRRHAGGDFVVGALRARGGLRGRRGRVDAALSAIHTDAPARLASTARQVDRSTGTAVDRAGHRDVHGCGGGAADAVVSYSGRACPVAIRGSRCVWNHDDGLGHRGSAGTNRDRAARLVDADHLATDRSADVGGGAGDDGTDRSLFHLHSGERADGIRHGLRGRRIQRGGIARG